MSETYKPEAPVNRPPAAGAAHAGGGHGHAEHGHSAAPYFIVWIALLFFTGLTVYTGHMHLGEIALPLALTIATIKALLVLWIFMHLNENPGAPRLIIAISVVFALVLQTFVMMDVTTRFAPLTPAGAPFGAKVILPNSNDRGVDTVRFGEKQPKADPQFGR